MGFLHCPHCIHRMIIVNDQFNAPFTHMLGHSLSPNVGVAPRKGLELSFTQYFPTTVAIGAKCPGSAGKQCILDCLAVRVWYIAYKYIHGELLVTCLHKTYQIR